MVPLGDLKAQYHSIKPEIDAALQNVLETSQFILGKEVADFEKDFASYCQTSFAVGVNSGTSALHLALLAAGVGPGDEVITVPFTFIATVAAIVYTGAKPVLVDIDPETFNMDVRKVKAAITPRTKVIMPVHLYGLCADMDPLLALAKEHGLLVIEDAAQAHGAEYKGRRAGSLGALGCFSFYPGKNLGAYGEGGAVTTSNPDYARKVKLLRDWGTEVKYHHDFKAFNYRMEGFQGAVLKVKLKHLESWTQTRRAHAKLYRELLKGASLTLPREPQEYRHVYHQFSLLVEKRDQLAEELKAAGIQTGIHYPIPVHLQKAYQDLNYKAGSFPVAEKYSRQVLSLPMFAELTEAQVREVAAAVVKTLKRTV